MFSKQNSASVNFMLTAAVWLVVGVLMGLTLALEFVFPDLFRGVPWLVFSRLRQAHTNTVMFAFCAEDGRKAIGKHSREWGLGEGTAQVVREAPGSSGLDFKLHKL